jgi:hypothetical protein
MDKILKVLTAIDDIDNMIEYIQLKEVDVVALVELAVETENTAISMLLKASKKIRETKITPVEQPQETRKPPPTQENRYFQDDITLEQFEQFRRLAWKTSYYFDDFCRDFDKLKRSNEGLEGLEIVKSKIRYLLMFVLRIVYDNGTNVVVMKTNSITKMSIIDYNSFSKSYGPKHGFYNINCPIEKETSRTTKTGKITKSIETENVSFWCFDGLVGTNNYTYYNFNWIPYSPYEIDPTFRTITFNMFLGLRAKIVPEVNMSLIQPILTHLKEIFADDNEEYYTYIISWFAHLIQFPREFLPFLLMIGPKRCGKSSFFFWFVMYVMGKGECGTDVENLDSIVAKFNSHTFQKLFIHVKELKGSTNDSHTSVYDKMELLKSRITDPTAEMEKKFGDRVQIDNYAKFGGCANEIPIRLSHDDKERWAIFKSSGRRIGDSKYFTEIKKIMSDKDNVPLAQEAANHFLTYLSKYQIKIDVRRDIPMTDIYTEILNLSTPQEKEFIKLLKSGEYKIPIFKVPVEPSTKPVEIKESTYWIRKLDFYLYFGDYCKTKRIYLKHNKEKFWSDIKNEVDTHRDRKEGNDLIYYLIPKKWFIFKIEINYMIQESVKNPNLLYNNLQLL